MESIDKRLDTSLPQEPSKPKNDSSSLRKSILRIGGILALAGAGAACSGERSNDPQAKALKAMNPNRNTDIEHVDVAQRFSQETLNRIKQLQTTSHESSMMNKMAPKAMEETVKSLVDDLTAKMSTGKSDYQRADSNDSDYMRALITLRGHCENLSDTELRSPGIQALLRIMQRRGLVQMVRDGETTQHVRSGDGNNSHVKQSPDFGDEGGF